MADEKQKEKPLVWDVDAEEQDIEIPITVLRDGLEYHFNFTFREPNASDKRARLRHLARTKIDRRNKGVVETDYPGANMMLFDRCIKQAVGYSVDNTSGVNWKSKIPSDHKIAVVDRLLESCGLVVDEEDEKN